MVTGMILLWSGSVANIPAGYVLCNGSNGTPDLRNKFIVGAGATYNPGDSGGALTHTHTFTANAHNHQIAAGSDIATGTGSANTTSSVAVTGTTDAGSSLPPYYALCYIMKT
jgi:hypothetical protein